MERPERSIPMLCDPGLVQASQAGDRRALAQLLARFRPLVRRTARRYAGLGLDLDDLVQEGCIGLYLALEAYRPDRGYPFERLASVSVRRRILSAVRAGTRDKDRPMRGYETLDEHALETEGPHGAIELREYWEQLLGTLRDTLSPFESRVLGLLLADRSPRELSSELSCSPKAIENAMTRIREKARLGARALRLG